MIYPKVIASWKVVIKKLKLLWYTRFCSRHHWELPAATLSFSTFDSVSREFEQKKVLNFGTSLYFRHTRMSGFGLFLSCFRILFLRTFASVQLSTSTRAHPDGIGYKPETRLVGNGQQLFGSLQRSINFATIFLSSNLTKVEYFFLAARFNSKFNNIIHKYKFVGVRVIASKRVKRLFTTE